MIYAALNGKGIFHYENGRWTKDSFLQDENFNSLHSGSSGLLIATTTELTQLTASGEFSPIESTLVTSPLMAVEDPQHKIWIGDRNNGLISDAGGNFFSYLPNGPSVIRATRLRSLNRNGVAVLVALPGGYTAGEPRENQGTLQLFENGQWQTDLRPINDLTDYEFFESAAFLSSFGDGVEKSETSSSTLIDHTNSPLENIDPSGRAINITALQTSTDGLWVANYGASQPLHVLKNNVWQSFALCCEARFPTDMVIDFNGNVWTIIAPEQGGGVHIFDPKNNSSVYRTDVPGNGALPDQAVRAIALDRDGLVWIGTDQGVAYFISPEADAIKPVFENRFLLRDEKITAIEVDGGNRKWVGSERGLWLFDPAGENQVLNFTTENSPLLSDSILDIAVDNASGEVFFATENGIVSFRADASAGEADFKSLKIFPNPVTSDFTGLVGISGLATDAIIKITDVSGKLIWQIQANGGTASWNVRDYSGRRASTGIYLVFAATADGSDREVGKIAVVE
jgi:ligand-binding sensor domain-containing protein